MLHFENERFILKTKIDMEKKLHNTTEPQHDAKLPVVCSCLSGEFVEGFTSDGELTPIDIVAEITGLTYDEIRSCSKIVRVP